MVRFSCRSSGKFGITPGWRERSVSEATRQGCSNHLGKGCERVVEGYEGSMVRRDEGGVFCRGALFVSP